MKRRPAPAGAGRFFMRHPRSVGFDGKRLHNEGMHELAPNDRPRRIRQPEGAYHYTLSPFHEPVARVPTGTWVSIACVDAFENRLTGDETSLDKLPGFPRCNPQTGPIEIEGARPGDTLRVEIGSIEITRDYAVAALIPGFGLLGSSSGTPMLGAALPERVDRLPIASGRVWFGSRSAPLAPFLGTIGTAPELEAVNSLTPDYYGGNLDCPQLAPGSTLCLPVQVEGAYFFVGDGHARQGDGEIGGVACEVPVELTCRFTLDREAKAGWPRIETETALMAVGAGRPLEDAARRACLELVRWVAGETGLEPAEALTWLTQVIELRAGNVVNPRYTMVASVQRRWLGE